MASIDRTAYPRFQSSLTATELQTLYRPSDEELRFVVSNSRRSVKASIHRVFPLVLS
jgi:hypothetical protein